MVVPLRWRQKLLTSATLIAFVCAFAQGEDHADPQFRKPINCDVLTDGNYVWGCSRFYSVCANGVEHSQYCYTGLVLNPENDQCDMPKDTIPCQTAGDVNLYKSKLPFTCNGRPDGNYEAGVCQPQYFQCIHGNRNTLPCPAGLVFVPKDNVCDWEANCKKVTNEKPSADRLEKIADPNVGNIGNANAANANANLGYRRSSGSAARNLPLHRSSSNQGPYQGKQVPEDQVQYQNQPIQQGPESPQAIDEDTAAVVDDTFIIGDSGESSGEEAPVQPQGPVPAQARYINQGLPPPPPPQPAVPQGYVSGQRSQPTTTQAPNPRQTRYGSNRQVTSPTKRDPSPTVEDVPFDCSGKEDGVYLKTQSACTSEFYKCANERGFQYQCPPGLSYNVDNNQCDYERFVIACGGTPPPTPDPADLKPRKAIQFDCRNKEDGLYANSTCSPVFFSCVAGHVSQINCAAGTVYDEVTQVCEFPQQCGKTESTTETPKQGISHDGGYLDSFYRRHDTRPQPNQNKRRTSYDQQSQGQYQGQPQVQTGDAPTRKPASKPIKFSCRDKVDGYYFKKPCVPTFVVCSAGHASTTQCPGNLVFDPSVAGCQYADQCGKPQPPTTTTQSPLLSSVTPMPKPDFDCSGRQDGYAWKQPCTNVFYMCNGGTTVELKCPATLVFDPNTTACEYPNLCGRKKPQQQRDVDSAPIVPNNYHPNIPTQATPQPIPDFNCGGLSDGFHAKQPCQPVFYSCVGGQTQQLACPATLLYDPNLSACTFADSCGRPVTTPDPVTVMPQQPQQSQSYYGQQQRPQQSQTLPPQIPDFNCGGQSDGFHAKQPCQAVFYSCVGGQTIQMTCPSNLLYDPSLSACVYANQCGQPVATTTAGPPQQQPQQSQSYYGQQQRPQQSQTLPPQIPDFNCGGQADGFHAKQPCQAVFYSCVGGQTIQMSCPSNLLYDPAVSACVFVDQCGNSATTTAVPPTQAPNVNWYYGQQQQQPQRPQSRPQQPQQQPQQSQTVPPQVPDFNCAGKPNGFQVKQPCQPVFYFCNGGVATQISCPSNLVYDPALSACVYVATCGQPVATTTADPPTQAPRGNWYNGQHQQQRPQQPQQSQTLPPQVPDFNCGGQPDGFHAKQPCQAVFYSCVGGQTSQLSCPASLLYDPTLSQCVFASQCGQSVSTTAAPPTQSPNVNWYYGQQQQPQRPQQPQQQPQQSQTVPPQVPDFNCGGQPDGFHAKQPCQAVFYSCVGGQATQITCPSNLVYDPALSACVYSDQCGQPVATTTADPPTQAPRGNWYNGQQMQRPQSRPQQQPQQSQILPPQIPDFNCGGQSDGFHAKQPCQAVFYSCVGGHTSQMACPSGLLYDSEMSACVFSDQCGQAQTTTTAPAQVPCNLQQSQQQQSQATPAPLSPVADFDCSGKQDGFYFKRACQPFYYSCVGGSATQIACPASLVFNPDIGACDYESQCGQPTTTTTVVPPTQPPPNSIYGQQQQRPQQQPQQPQAQSSQTTPTPPDFNCGGQPDGFHAKQPCQPVFYSCVGGHVSQMNCPSGLLYDTDQVACVYADVCGIPVTTTASSFVSQPGQQPISQSRPQQQTQSQAQYQAQNQVQSQTPEDQQQEQPQFLNPLNVPAQPQEGSQVAPIPSGQPTIQTIDNIQNPGGNPCADLENGIYGRRCSRFYFSCSNGATIEYVCPEREVFDTSRATCTAQGHVEACLQTVHLENSKMRRH